MQIPFANQAIVHDAKLIRYLLNLSHPRGAGKARFFLSLGFRPDESAVLRDLLLDLLGRADAVAVPHAQGTKYLVEGEVQTPDGRTVRLRTIWMLDGDRPPPRLGNRLSDREAGAIIEPMRIAEHDQVLLQRDLSAAGLCAGDVGVIVGIYGNGAAFEVEFLTADGDTVAVETLTAEDVEPLAGRRILNARPLLAH